MRAFSWLLCVALFLICLTAVGQAPPGINYQAVARDKDGKALVSKDISVRISILQNNENGEIEYSEKHSLKTNPFGLFMLVIGHGETLSGNFEFISWAVGNKWLRIEFDPDGGNFFQLMGAQQLMSVPYAFYAKYSGNGYIAGPGISINNSTITNTGDADNNPTNETITQVTLTSDNKLRISEAGSTKEADLSSLVGDGQNLAQVLTLGNSAGSAQITDLATPTAGSDAATKSYVDNHNDADADVQNEIQDLNLTGNTLKVTKNSTATAVDLTPYLDNTDSQSLALAGTSLSISGGNAVNLASINTDNQNLTVTTVGTQHTVGISNGTGITIDVADNDNSATNEIQDLALSANQLSITNNSTPTVINLAPYLDNTDSQTLATQSVDANTRSLSVSGGNVVNMDVRDADFSTTNEIQDLTRTGNTLSLTNDVTTVDLSPYLDNTDAQTLSTASVDANTRSVSVSGGNSVNVDVRDADFSTTNEIQDLTRTGNTLSLTNDASTVDLSPYLDNTDAQSLTYNATSKALSISGGNSVTITETQTLSQVLSAGNSAGSQQITNIASPTANNDATTKKYVDDADAVLASRISTTYAFKTAFAYTNSSGVVTNDQTIPFSTEDFDDFNVLATNQFTASEAGVYVFGVDGSYFAAVAGGQLSILYNGTKYPIAILQPWGSALARYNATMMLKLTAGQTVTLIADNVLVGAQFNGTFFGYKL